MRRLGQEAGGIPDTLAGRFEARRIVAKIFGTRRHIMFNRIENLLFGIPEALRFLLDSTAKRASLASVLFLIMLALSSGAVRASAQTTATISGTVADQKGGVIPGAQLSITN